MINKEKETDLDSLYKQAAIFYQKGRLEEVVKICQQILNDNPYHADTNHLFGIVMLQVGRYDVACQLISKAITISSNRPIYYINLGFALKQKGQLNHALEAFERALKLSPKLAEAHYGRGLILQLQGSLNEAVSFYNNAIKFRPKYAEAYNNRGLILQQQKKFTEAIDDFNQAIQIFPKYAEAYNNRGNTLTAQGKLEEAIDDFNQAIDLQPHYVEAYSNQGLVFLKQGQHDKALKIFDRVIKISPNFVEGHRNRAIVLQKQEKLEEALKGFNHVLTLSPEYADVYRDRGLILQQQGRLEDALENFEQAIKISPHYVEALNDQGIVLKELGRLEDAKELFESITKKFPDYIKAKCNLSFILLLLGKFKEGFRYYEYRFEDDDFPSEKDRFNYPMWDGSSLCGKTLLLYTEQGMGDNIQFIRYVSLAKQWGGKVVLKCDKPLEKLFSSILDMDELVVNDKPKLAIDVQASLMSLPYLLGTTIESIPNDVPYLFSPKVGPTIEKNLQCKNIGIVWAGQKGYKNDKNRSIDIDYFSQLFDLEVVNFFSLQVGERSLDIEKFSSKKQIKNLSQLLTDFSVTAFIINQLDLVISVDTAVAHLTGALGKPVWTLLPFSPDWRWMLNRDDSPWYPTMRLFRQSRLSDWQSVFEKVKMELVQWIKN